MISYTATCFGLELNVIGCRWFVTRPAIPELDTPAHLIASGYEPNLTRAIERGREALTAAAESWQAEFEDHDDWATMPSLSYDM